MIHKRGLLTLAKIIMKVEYDDTHCYDNSIAMVETSDDFEFTSLEDLFKGFAKLVGFSEAVVDREINELNEDYTRLDKKYEELKRKCKELEDKIKTNDNVNVKRA